MSIGVINKFNDCVRIDEVYELVTGNKINKGNCKCPFHNSELHNKSNAGIDLKRNGFSCFSHKCATSMKPYEFIAKYHKLENEKFTVIAQKVNEYYPNSFQIYSENNEEFLKEKNECVLSNFYLKIEKKLTQKIQERINWLNIFFFNKQGIEVDIIKMKELWNYVKVNEFYCSIADYVKIDENIGSFKINEEILNNEIMNRVLKFRNKNIKYDEIVNNIIETGKKISNEYIQNPCNEIKERLEKYRFEYTLLNKEFSEKEKNTLSIKDKLSIANRSGLEYLEVSNIENILKNNDIYDLNKQICKVISEQEKDAFICGNIDYTVSLTYVKPFNDNNILIEDKHIKSIELELEILRKSIGSTFKDRYFCNKELDNNKKIMTLN